MERDAQDLCDGAVRRLRIRGRPRGRPARPAHGHVLRRGLECADRRGPGDDRAERRIGLQAGAALHRTGRRRDDVHGAGEPARRAEGQRRRPARSGRTQIGTGFGRTPRVRHRIRRADRESGGAGRHAAGGGPAPDGAVDERAYPSSGDGRVCGRRKLRVGRASVDRRGRGPDRGAGWNVAGRTRSPARVPPGGDRGGSRGRSARRGGALPAQSKPAGRLAGAAGGGGHARRRDPRRGRLGRAGRF